MDDGRLVEAVEELAATVSPLDLDRTLGRITSAAVEALPDVDYASISIQRVDGSIETVAPTDPMLCDLDARQYELREGPCFEAATTSSYVSAPDLANDDRYPDHARNALAVGIRSQAAVRLFNTEESQAALNLYSRRTGSFSDFASLAALFAEQSARVLEYAQEIEVLRQAAHTRELVGRAVGISMERYGLSEPRAFALLTRLSQHHDMGIAEVAESIVAASQGRADD